MKKSLFEQMAGTYREASDYFIPNISLSDTEERPIGIWGEQCRRYLKAHHRVLYYNLLTAEKLNASLAEINEQAEEMFSRLVSQLAEKDGITEKLKADDAMAWVQSMNSIRNRAMEIVNNEIVFYYI